MADFEIKFDNHSEEVKSEFNSEMIKRLEMCGLAGEGYAKQLVHVVTGRLRNSISHTVDTAELAAYIGTNVEYAAAEELGDSKRPAHPYLKPAVANYTDVYRNILKNG